MHLKCEAPGKCNRTELLRDLSAAVEELASGKSLEQFDFDHKFEARLCHPCRGSVLTVFAPLLNWIVDYDKVPESLTGPRGVIQSKQ